jgi:steroid delta-isomerase-like uncharacterized protein
MNENYRTFLDNFFQAWNSHNPCRVKQLYADNYQGIDVSQAAPHYGHDGIQQMLAVYWEAFPDLVFSGEDTIQEGNRVAVVWQARGTHLGRVMNIPPTGKKMTVRGTTILTIENERIKRALYIWDVAGLLRDIGLLPEL